MDKAIKLQSKKSTELEIFKPTPSMEKWLDTALELMSDSPLEIANASGLDRSTWYKWLKDERFIIWFKQQWDRRLAGEAYKLDAIGMRRAKVDHKYWSDMQRRVGNLTDVRPGTDVNLSKRVTFEQFFDTEDKI